MQIFLCVLENLKFHQVCALLSPTVFLMELLKSDLKNGICTWSKICFASPYTTVLLRVLFSGIRIIRFLFSHTFSDNWHFFHFCFMLHGGFFRNILNYHFFSNVFGFLLPFLFVVFFSCFLNSSCCRILLCLRSKYN